MLILFEKEVDDVFITENILPQVQSVSDVDDWEDINRDNILQIYKVKNK